VVKTLLVLILYFTALFAEIPTSIHCYLIKDASVKLVLAQGGKILEKPYFDNNCEGSGMGEFTIGDLETNKPILIGNSGTSELKRLQLTPDSSTLYLAEITPSGNVNILTIFLKTNAIIFSKQYQLIVNPFGMVSIGYFKPIK